MTAALTGLNVFCDVQRDRILRGQRPPAAAPPPLRAKALRQAARRDEVRQPLAPWHGTLSGYTARACRCYLCREAASEYRRRRRAERRA